jgi:hypothetical protein
VLRLLVPLVNHRLLLRPRCLTDNDLAQTNLMNGIDPAALRRFDLKIRFGYFTCPGRATVGAPVWQ